VIAGRRCGLDVVFEKAFDAHSSGVRAAYKPFLGAVNLFTRCVETVTAGRINLLLADYVVLFKKVEGFDPDGQLRPGSKTDYRQERSDASVDS